jgi:serine/threonine protein kinase
MRHDARVAMSLGSYDDFGRFRLLERIGAGGMGEVFRAEMRGPDRFSRIVVVKRMLPDLTAEAGAVAMFVDEARLSARLVHPNIVQVYDFGRVEGRYFLVMEYVAGCDLSRLLSHLDEHKRRLPVAAVVRITAALLNGLAYAHELRDDDGTPLNVVHRDVAPSNVLLGARGEIKLTDFGIAKTRDRLEHTRAGVIKGKFHYMSPEQASAGELDARSDLFAVGVILFKMLTGQRPFRGASGDDVLANIKSGTYPRAETLNPELDRRLAAVMERSLQTRPDDRFQTAREFRSALLACNIEQSATDFIGSLVNEVATPYTKHPPPSSAPSKPSKSSKPSETTEVLTNQAVDETSSPIAATDELTAPAPGSSMPMAVPVKTAVATAVGEPVQRPATSPIVWPSLPTAASQPSGASAPSNVTTTSTVVIHTKHVVLGVLVLVALLGLTLFVASRLSDGGAAASKTRVVRVALRMYPAQAEWLKQEVFAPFARANNCKVEVVEFNATGELAGMLANGEADVAKIDVQHAPMLVELGRLQRIPPLAERVDSKGWAALRAALRPEAIRFGTFQTTIGDDLYLVPRKLETGQLFYRPSAVHAAVRAFPAHQEALDARLREVIGHGLPEGFTPSKDPARWTSWDLIAISWVWAHEPFKGKTEPRYALRAQVRVLMEAIANGAPEREPWRTSPAMVSLFYEYAVMRELDVLHPDTYKTIEYAKVRELLSNGGLAAFIVVQIDVGILVGSGRGLPQQIDNQNDWDVAPLPRVVDLAHAGTAPLVPESLSEVWGWGWGVPRNSREPELAMKLIMNIVSRERHTAELEQFPILSVRKDVQPVSPIARRVNEVGDAQFWNGRARYIAWPIRAGELEQAEERIERAFRDIIIDRSYRGVAVAIDRAKIEARLRAILDAD